MQWFLTALALLLLVPACQKSSDPQPVPAPPSVAELLDGPITVERDGARPQAELEVLVRKFCQRTLDCAGKGGDRKLADDCVAAMTQNAEDDLSAGILRDAFLVVAKECDKSSCESYGDCYVEAMKKAEATMLGEDAPPVPALSAAERARLVRLTCEAAAENQGKIPDVYSPAASPKLKELRAAMEALGSPTAISEIMKEAMRVCP